MKWKWRINGNSAAGVSRDLTLSADHYDRDVWAEGAELTVELVQLLKTGLVFQTEDQEDCVDPAAELWSERRR